MNQPPASSRGTPPAALLWTTAAVLAALTLVQLGRTSIGSTARAEMVSQTGDFTLMTTNGGNDDVIAVIDNRGEDLTIYRVDNQSALELYQRIGLQQVFTNARARSSSGTK
jgi:hypothetical protein